MAASYVGIGTSSASVGSIDVGMPPSSADGDLLILLVETSNVPIASITDWTKLTSFGVGSAGTTGVALDVFWRFKSGNTAVTVADSGDHTLGVILAFRDVDQTSPIYAHSMSGSATSATSRTLPSVNTDSANSIVVNVLALTEDSASTAIASSWTNTNTSPTEIFDRSVSIGNGGGIAVAYGTLASAGASGTTTVSHLLGPAVWGSFSIKNISPINTNMFFNFF